ncbi:MAG: stage III sporulation protein AF, partial [Syntrophomonadaceae bacterium]|nr:stage III sporulation protein AF [Syntrophomonadaceae bacterium]
LLPESGLKSFVSFAMGLFVLIAILNPLLGVAFKNQDFKVELWDYKYNQDLEQDIADKGLIINEQLYKTNDDLIQQKLQGQISAIAALVPGVQEVETTIDKESIGSSERVRLVVRLEQREPPEQTNNIGVFNNADQEKLSKEEQDRIRAKILMVVNNLYGIKSEQLEIEFEGGEF